jgi:hypothetical protein
MTMYEMYLRQASLKTRIWLDKLDTLERLLLKSEAVRKRVKRDADVAIAMAQDRRK